VIARKPSRSGVRDYPNVRAATVREREVKPAA